MFITWIGHASFKIVSKSGFVIYIDPFAGDDALYSEKANAILVSHEGYHHLGYEKIRLIRLDSTILISTSQAVLEVGGKSAYSGDIFELEEISVKAVDAYSLRPGTGRLKGESLGFLIRIDGKTVYFAGSTDLIPEIGKIVCDIALLPVSGSRTMGPKQASEAVRMIIPKTAIPMYYGMHCGTIEDAEYFAELCRQYTDTEVLILKNGETVEF